MDINNQENCKCFEGWSGENCDIVDCPEIFCGLNGLVLIKTGKCDSEDDKLVCRCNPGWSGETCSTISCDNWKGCKPDGSIYLI